MSGRAEPIPASAIEIVPATLRAQLELPVPPGFLAYVDGDPAGWCGVGGRRVDVGFAFVGLASMFDGAGFRRVVETGAHSAGLPRILVRLDF
jgi:hypothetical protein